MKDYTNRNIQDEVNKKINSLDRIRNNRIYASERLYKYSSHWEFLFFLMNVVAVVLLIMSLGKITNGSEDEIVISSIFSIYTILVQYYTITLNYNERALKLHYEQLEIEDCILNLKTILRKFNEEQINIEQMESSYTGVMSVYQTSLKGAENHSEIDDLMQKHIIEKSLSQKPHDFSVDNGFIYFNYLLIIIILTYYFVIFF